MKASLCYLLLEKKMFWIAASTLHGGVSSGNHLLPYKFYYFFLCYFVILIFILIIGSLKKSPAFWESRNSRFIIIIILILNSIHRWLMQMILIWIQSYWIMMSNDALDDIILMLLTVTSKNIPVKSSPLNSQTKALESPT